MFTIAIALIAAVLVAFLTGRDLGAAWGVICGLAAAMATQIVIGLIIRKKMTAVNAAVEAVMARAQAKINRRVQQWQQRPPGSPQMMRQMLEKEQRAATLEALESTKAAEKYYKWNLLLKKQISTMRMMLYFQLKDYKSVDGLLPHCLLLDSRSIAMKIVRMYRKDDPKLDKFFRRKIRRRKGADCVLLYSLYAWILIKRGENDKALALLIEARKKTDHPVIVENWERLVNGKYKQFSNAALGDEWYSLYLEEPKIKQQRMTRQPY